MPPRSPVAVCSLCPCTTAQIAMNKATPETLVRLPLSIMNRTYNLKLHGLALELDGANLEVDTDSANVALGIRVVGEPK